MPRADISGLGSYSRGVPITQACGFISAPWILPFDIEQFKGENLVALDTLLYQISRPCSILLKESSFNRAFLFGIHSAIKEGDGGTFSQFPWFSKVKSLYRSILSTFSA